MWLKFLEAVSRFSHSLCLFFLNKNKQELKQMLQSGLSFFSKFFIYL
ncbi:protein of unknown function [Tenacibaculum aestuariivivum]